MFFYVNLRHLSVMASFILPQEDAFCLILERIVLEYEIWRTNWTACYQQF